MVDEKSLYEVLGVDSDADAEEIKAAYRALAKTTHPDVEGGSEQAFREVEEAYRVLSDPELRAVYDEHDFIPSRADMEKIKAEALRVVTTYASSIIDAENVPIGFDFLAEIRGKLSDGMSRAHQIIYAEEQRIAKGMRLIKRFTGSGAELFTGAIQKRMADCRTNIMAQRRNKMGMALALDLIDDVNFKPEDLWEHLTTNNVTTSSTQTFRGMLPGA